MVILIIGKVRTKMVKIEIKQKTLNRLQSLFETEKKKPIKTVKGILHFMDKKMKENLLDENKSRRRRNYSSALISDNYFFALFFFKGRYFRKGIECS